MFRENELYHHGVKGQKWGVRREAKEELKAARSRFKTAREELRSKAPKNIIANRESARKLEKLNKQYRKAEFDVIDKKAKYRGVKSRNSQKAEFNTYVKEMHKSGLSGSYKDSSLRGRSTKLYDHIAAQKGKDYADKVEKKVANRLVGELAASAAVTAGTVFVTAYLAYR